MKKNTLLSISLSALCLVGCGGGEVTQTTSEVKIHEEATGQPVIPAEIYGQFSEHLGRCIYDGIWVGKDSPIPNVDGYRTDLLEALKALKVPVLRWPGGCFADEYHWRDGIGPQSGRPVIVNNNWGGTREDNSFGTHEFMNLCELLGTEPYVSGNVGSGTVEELAEWVQYMTAESGTLAEERAANGREEPWHLKYLGVGNESWGCGGNMRPEYYSDLFRRYAIYCRDYDGNELFKVASGASDYDYNWTKVLMKNHNSDMAGLSLHYYTVMDWDEKGSATVFSDSTYYDIIGKAAEVDEVLRKHEAIMKTYDPDFEVALLLDEWGTWFEVEPGTNPGHLYQQNTMRDAMVAAISLNIFNGHTERLKMANIAQVVNVLQAMILTEGDKMVLTPTYHVFRMYTPHQNATYVPCEYDEDAEASPSGRPYPGLSVSVSSSEGALHVSLANTSLTDPRNVVLSFDTLQPESVTGEVLSSAKIADYNDFDDPEKVAPKPFTEAKAEGGKVSLTLPAASVVVLEVK